MSPEKMKPEPASTKPLTVTSRTHALAITVYCHYVLLWVLFFFNPPSRAIDEWLSDWLEPIWAMLHLPAAILCLGGALLAPHLNNPIKALRVELTGLSLLVLLQSLHLGAMWDTYGFYTGAAVYYEVIITLIVVGAIATIIQGLRDARKIRRAAKKPRLATEPLVAEAPPGTT